MTAVGQLSPSTPCSSNGRFLIRQPTLRDATSNGRSWPISATLGRWLTVESELDAPYPITEEDGGRTPVHGALVQILVTTPDADAKLA